MCTIFFFARTIVGKRNFRAVRTEPEHDQGTGIRVRDGMRSEKVPRIVLAVLSVQPGKADMHAGHGRTRPTPFARHQQPVFRHPQGIWQSRG